MCGWWVGADARGGGETVPGRSVECRHDRTHHLVPDGRALLLVTGYLSPLPPKRRSGETRNLRTSRLRPRSRRAALRGAARRSNDYAHGIAVGVGRALPADRSRVAGGGVSEGDARRSRRSARVQCRRHAGPACVLRRSGRDGAEGDGAIAAGVRSARRASRSNERHAGRGADAGWNAGRRERCLAPGTGPRIGAFTSSMRATRRSRARDSFRLAQPGRRLGGAGQHRGERRSRSLANNRAREHAVAGDRGDQQLRRERIELPRQSYDYLRVQRIDGGPPLAINRSSPSASARCRRSSRCGSWRRCSSWTIPKILFFDTARRAPVTYARLRLPQENSSVRVTLQSRKDGIALVRALERRSVSDRYGHGAARKSAGAFRVDHRSLLAGAVSRRIRSCIARRAGAGLSTGARAVPGARSGPVHAGVRQPAGGNRRIQRAATVCSPMWIATIARRWSAKALSGQSRARRRQCAATAAAPDAGAGRAVDGAGRRGRPAGRDGVGAAQAGSESG